MRASSDYRSQPWEPQHHLEWRSLADLDNVGWLRVKVILQGEKTKEPLSKS